MPKHHQSLNVPYAPEQLFELVSDIVRYPEFVKWIKALRVSNPQVNGDLHTCIGEAVVGFKGFTESFSTSVAANSEDKTVVVKLVRGPFRKLENNWRFSSNYEGGSVIDFTIEYEFSNLILRALASANKDIAIDRIMGAFLDEAKRRYG